MNARQKSIVAALSGAVVVGSVAYALGSQAGGGSADAASQRSPAAVSSSTAPVHWRGPGGRFGRGAALDDLAAKLGVSADALRDAFAAVRADLPRPGNKRVEFAKVLADALGIEEAKVTAALDKLRGSARRDRGTRREAFLESLAKAIGVEPAKLRDALTKVRGAHPGRGDFAAELAKELGVSEDKVEDAFRSLRPRPGRPGPRLRGGLEKRFDEAALANELGVTEAQLRAAFDKLHDQARAEAEKRYNEFTEALAKRLNIDVAKVREALSEFPGRFLGPGHGHGFRRGRP